MKIKNPGIRILDRYIIRKFLGTYFFAIALIIVIVVVFDAAERMDDFLERHAPFSEIVVTYYLNFIPYFINQFSGLFTFIAVIFFTSKMAYQSEIIAILSSGVNFRRMLWPYFLSAAVITIISLTLNLFVIPVANAHRLEFEARYFKKNLVTQYDRHIYRQVYPGTFVYIRDYNGESRSASFMALETYQDGAMVSSLEAAGISFDPETTSWSAPQYITRTFEGETEIFEKHEKLDTVVNITSEELDKVENLIKTMSTPELNRFIRQQKSKGSDMVAVFEVERYNRVAYPVATFVLTLIGVSLSSRKVRGGAGLHIGIGITLCFSYILFMKFAEEFAKGGILPAVISIWIPNMIYAFIALYLYRKAPK
ncbi:MAG: LptF/LptG family permease [Rikenellaceae bacterium]|jgi:lipopolysaccharide export system permease protein|nr:LptF/LptG family permease [Rikenellaceae bacterium]